MGGGDGFERVGAEEARRVGGGGAEVSRAFGVRGFSVGLLYGGADAGELVDHLVVETVALLRLDVAEVAEDPLVGGRVGDEGDEVEGEIGKRLRALGCLLEVLPQLDGVG